MKRKIIIISIIGLIALGLIGALIMTATGSSKYDKQIEFGNKYLEEGNYEEAILAFQEAIDIDPNSIEARIGLSKSYIGLEEYEKAEKVIREGITKDQTNTELGDLLIEIYEAKGCHKEEIIEIYKEVYKSTNDEKYQDWIDEHTPEKKMETIKSESYDEELEIEITQQEFIFPNSNIQKLSEEDILAVDSELWAYGRNEIFARHGYVFKTEKYRTYFSIQPWYNSSKDNNKIKLNDIEEYNADLIKSYEDKNLSKDNNTTNNLSQIKIYESNKEIYIDLNGDNTKEKIIYKQISTDTHSLFINDVEYSSHLDNFDCTVDYFGITDIDTSDTFREILISTVGWSDDYATVYYYYDGISLIDMGFTGGLIDFGIKINGAGEIIASERACILQTWFYDYTYKISKDHRIQSSNQQYFNTDSKVKLIEPLIVFEEPDKGSKKYTINPNQMVNIVMTDDKMWCKVVADDKKAGWFSVTSYAYLDEQNKEAYEVFEGLCYAD